MKKNHQIDAKIAKKATHSSPFTAFSYSFTHHRQTEKGNGEVRERDWGFTFGTMNDDYLQSQYRQS